MNAKGGSDVVAIVGHQVGLLSGLAYTSYTVVAIITVLFTPTAMRMQEHRSSASGTERQRLENEQASARAYTFTIERVLIPASAELYPELAMEALEKLALSQNRANRPRDITRLRVTTTGTCANDRVADVATSPVLDWSGSVQLFHSSLTEGRTSWRALRRLRPATTSPPLAPTPSQASRRWVGWPTRSSTAAAATSSSSLHPDGRLPWPSVGRILVPTNGLPSAAAAADLGGLIAESTNAELVLLNVTASRRSRAGDSPSPNSAVHLDDLSRRLTRLGIRQRTGFGKATSPGMTSLPRSPNPISTSSFSAAPTADRVRSQPYLGGTVERLLSAAAVPLILLVTRNHHTQ
ncbi:MAG TPA: hypothetical protein VE196_13735 [Pseudonocardiaceae bacterium]|nr:hypothetical protein [Pseudonocardiaceae bacterium]